jgi:hypothetical protein
VTYDPSITVQVFRGLIYCAISLAAGFGLGLFLLALLPTWDEG